MSQRSKTNPSNCRNNSNGASVSNAPFSLCSNFENPSFEEAFASVARLLQGRKNILVLAGAGMSVSCGIPDFRSKDGLYSGLDVESLGLSCPEDLFDFDFFKEDPAPFYQFARRLYFPKGTTNTKVEPSDSHRFLAHLEQQNRLLRVYTQNIDGLEQQAGVSEKHIVYAHGSLQWATCLKCKHKLNASEIEESILKGVVPRCQQPIFHKETKNGLEGVESTPRSSKRHRPAERHSASTMTANGASLCGGVLKPGVVFFGEPLNGNVKRTFESDRDKADALIVIGTSLSVAPMSHVLEFVPKHLPRVLINRNIVHPPIRQRVKDDSDNGDDKKQDDETVDFREGYMFDVYMLGFCDDVTRALVKEMTGLDDPRGKEGGRLLACLKDEDERYELKDWESTRLPKDRVFLFPGAQSGDSLFEYSYREVAHCDGCSNQIEGTIRKCTQCFDYDLCEACFPRLSLTHHGGQHAFSYEAAG